VGPFDHLDERALVGYTGDQEGAGVASGEGGGALVEAQAGLLFRGAMAGMAMVTKQRFDIPREIDLGGASHSGQEEAAEGQQMNGAGEHVGVVTWTLATGTEWKRANAGIPN
jgi:hypothetical protein